MTAHIAHGDVYTDGLVSACPRCQEIAAAPEFYGDARLLRRLFEGGPGMSALDVEARERLITAREEGRFTGWTTSG